MTAYTVSVILKEQRLCGSRVTEAAGRWKRLTLVQEGDRKHEARACSGLGRNRLVMVE